MLRAGHQKKEPIPSERMISFARPDVGFLPGDRPRRPLRIRTRTQPRRPRGHGVKMYTLTRNLEADDNDAIKSVFRDLEELLANQDGLPTDMFLGEGIVDPPNKLADYLVVHRPK